MIIELKVKNEEDYKIFTINFPQVKTEAEIPKKIMINYEEDTRRCETFNSYGFVPPMEVNCNHKPTENGWIQTYLNVHLSGEKSEPQHEKVQKSDV